MCLSSSLSSVPPVHARLLCILPVCQEDTDTVLYILYARIIRRLLKRRDQNPTRRKVRADPTPGTASVPNPLISPPESN
ncbi:uncharacterized protein BO66DRAFT_56914 [Aspergillus aculeatinus CBS 121060]|uniref:Uncharacterized protein n=1 Tax=Aspergillus aculeatinus CBS 121060 TaxID=1448322 RepID=A0ACD1HCV2_9EURO|nr:hypothetical protein BO66DRAFT_56914 [Aspergillus aculeatinus CBS 121060]RAH71394.1 hypothetical protein BO66DRAFT_56914 [Aspergillus aculeatinus CBS 121060]